MNALENLVCPRTGGAVLLVAALVAPGFAARAADDDEPDVVVAAPARPMINLNEALFNQLVYGRMPPDEVRERFERILTLRITYIDRTCGLSQAQKEKLELAGKGEIKRRLDGIEDRKNVVNRRVDQDEYVKLMGELQKVNQTLNAELFGDGSLFSKALKTTLAEDQAARYGDVEREKERERYRNRVEQYVTSLDNVLGLTAEQRRRLVSLLLDETRAPKKFGPADMAVIQYQMARLPEDHLKPIFDEIQWRSLSRRFDASSVMMDQVLKKTGDYLPDRAKAGPATQPNQPAAKTKGFTGR